MPETNVNDFIGELGAGIFKEKLAHALSDCALGTLHCGDKKKKGKVTIEMTLSQIGDNSQVNIAHKLSYVKPNRRGKSSEEETSETPMYVGKGGVLSVTPPKEEINGQFTLSSIEGSKDQ